MVAFWASETNPMWFVKHFWSSLMLEMCWSKRFSIFLTSWHLLSEVGSNTLHEIENSLGILNLVQANLTFTNVKAVWRLGNSKTMSPIWEFHWNLKMGRGLIKCVWVLGVLGNVEFGAKKNSKQVPPKKIGFFFEVSKQWRVKGIIGKIVEILGNMQKNTHMGDGRL